MAEKDIAYAGVTGQLELLRSREVSSRELVELCLDRIARHDPQLNAFRVVFAERALEEAARADDARNGDAPPLLGLPIAVKDDMDVKGEVTAKGSIAHGGPAKVDAKIVRLLREAGAVVIGKTHVPELMTMAFTETPWYGATRNPWDLDRTPGGSSGGSGAAVAAGLVPAATGSDGAGSIRIPAACCGLVGLKPRKGLVPTPSPDWQGLSTYGFITRTVADAALLYDTVKTGGEPLAEAAAREPGRLRVAWSLKVPLGVRSKPDATQRGAMDSMTETLSSLGHDVFRQDPDLGFGGANVVIRYLAGIAEDAASMPHKERLGRRSRDMAAMGRLLPRTQVERANHAADADRRRFERIFEDADVVVLPLFTSLPPRIGEYERLGGLRSMDKALAYTPWPGLFNHMGLPAIAVPTERTHDGFPLAVQIVGPRESEGKLLSLAAQLESAIRWPDRRPPGFEAAA